MTLLCQPHHFRRDLIHFINGRLAICGTHPARMPPAIRFEMTSERRVKGDQLVVDRSDKLKIDQPKLIVNLANLTRFCLQNVQVTVIKSFNRSFETIDSETKPLFKWSEFLTLLVMMKGKRYACGERDPDDHTCEIQPLTIACASDNCACDNVYGNNSEARRAANERFRPPISPIPVHAWQLRNVAQRNQAVGSV